MAVHQSDDPLECFSSVADSVPEWLRRIAKLAEHTAARHAEFSAEYAKLARQGTRVLPQRRRKTSSMHSHRSAQKDDKPIDEEGDAHQADARPLSDTSSACQLDTDDPFRDPLTLIRISRAHPQDLKRKHPDTFGTASALGSRLKTRPRHTVIVRYDSYTQQGLEMLVRDFGGARNRLRKSRMQQMMKRGFGFRCGYPSLSNDPEFDGMRPAYRSARANPSKSVKLTQDESPFELIDKHLESVQSLCESSAHQFLRIGDCSVDLQKTKEQLEMVLTMARSEAERLRIEQQHSKANKSNESQNGLTTRPKVAKPDLIPLHGLDEHIEVDDDESDTQSISIDIGAFRRSRLR